MNRTELTRLGALFETQAFTDFDERELVDIFAVRLAAAFLGFFDGDIPSSLNAYFFPNGLFSFSVNPLKPKRYLRADLKHTFCIRAIGLIL
jgi:hypothetical protein